MNKIDRIFTSFVIGGASGIFIGNFFFEEIKPLLIFSLIGGLVYYYVTYKK